MLCHRAGIWVCWTMFCYSPLLLTWVIFLFLVVIRGWALWYLPKFDLWPSFGQFEACCPIWDLLHLHLWKFVPNILELSAKEFWKWISQSECEDLYCAQNHFLELPCLLYFLQVSSGSLKQFLSFLLCFTYFFSNLNLYPVCANCAWGTMWVGASIHSP